MVEQENVELVPLVSGVISDIKNLVKQEIALVRSEIKSEVLDFKKSIVMIVVSLIFAMLSIMMVGFACVYMLAQFAPQVEMWILFSLVAVLALLVSSCFLLRGLRKGRVIQTIVPSRK